MKPQMVLTRDETGASGLNKCDSSSGFKLKNVNRHVNKDYVMLIMVM